MHGLMNTTTMSLKLTIFIIYYTLDDFDIADPSSMQHACHISI